MTNIENKLMLAEKRRLIVLILTKSGAQYVGKVKVSNFVGDKSVGRNVIIYKYESLDVSSINIKHISKVYKVVVSK